MIRVSEHILGASLGVFSFLPLAVPEVVELPQIPYTDPRHFNGRPGGGMADAEDLKSSGDFSSWGFDSPPGHH